MASHLFEYLPPNRFEQYEALGSNFVKYLHTRITTEWAKLKVSDSWKTNSENGTNELLTDKLLRIMTSEILEFLKGLFIRDKSVGALGQFILRRPEFLKACLDLILYTLVEISDDDSKRNATAIVQAICPLLLG
jgi:hypothetical protein